jgi:molybdenum cofactor synthesis domain-containing protein
MRPPTASLVVVGSEILSAKVPDENGPWVAARLRELGVELRAIHTVPDRIDDVVEAVDRARRRSGWVLTSGGIGPTHDDITVVAVALALGRPVVRLEPLAEAIRSLHRLHHGGAEPPDAAMRMADVPEGTRLVGDQGYPTLICENLAMLPGVPRFFRWQFERFAPLLTGVPFRLASVEISVGEGTVAPALEAVAHANPTVEIGSYPRFDDADHAVRLTVEGRDLPAVERALEALLAALPPGCVVRVQRPVP